ncbi:hypothetical protein MHYP_G00090790 [Metynnis hypsauchen]
MATNPEVLLYALQSFEDKDLKTFQWHLTNGVEGFTPIQKAHLQKADRPDTVDQMVQRYGRSRAVEITLAILKKMNQNQLAEELTTKLKDGKICGERSEEVPGQNTAASSTAAQTEDSVSAVTAGAERSEEVTGTAASSTAAQTEDSAGAVTAGWYRGEKRAMHFAVPRIWREPTDHSTNCYFCMVDPSKRRTGKNATPVTYPDIPSSIAPVPHCPELPVPTPPDRATPPSEESSRSDTQEDVEDHDFSSCADEERKPYYPNQKDLNDLIRDLETLSF